MQTLERMFLAKSEEMVDAALPHLIQTFRARLDDRRLFHFLTAASRLVAIPLRRDRVRAKLLMFALMLAAPVPWPEMRRRLVSVLTPKDEADELAVLTFARAVGRHFHRVRSGYEPSFDDVDACASLLRRV